MPRQLGTAPQRQVPIAENPWRDDTMWKNGHQLAVRSTKESTCYANTFSKQLRQYQPPGQTKRILRPLRRCWSVLKLPSILSTMSLILDVGQGAAAGLATSRVNKR